MKEHYFKQKIYGVDRLLNRQFYLEVSIAPIRKKHQIIQSSLRGGTLPVETLQRLKNKEEKRRLQANKEFSKNYWRLLQQKQNLVR